MSTLEYKEPPCNTEELFNINFYTNLQNFLNSLVDNDKELYSSINNHAEKLNEMDLLKEQQKETAEKLEEVSAKLNSTIFGLRENAEADQELTDKLNFNIEVNNKS